MQDFYYLVCSTFHQVFDGIFTEKLLQSLIKLSPHGHSPALGLLRTFKVLVGYTGYGYKIVLGCMDYVPCGAFFGALAKLISAALTANSLDDSGLNEILDDGFKVFFGDSLSVSYFTQGYELIRVVSRNIDYDAKSVSSLG